MISLTERETAELADLSRRYPTQALVPAELAGQPVAALIGPLFDIGAGLSQLLMLRGSIWLNGQRVIDPLLPAPPAGRIVVHTPPGGAYVWPEVTPAMILYEDASLLVINKPPGWFSVPNPWDALGNLEVALERFISQRDGEHEPLHLVHRLDRDTSGILIVSKDPALNSKFQQLFAQSRVRKTYQAWCGGGPAWDHCEVRTGHARGENGVWQVYPAEQIGERLGPKDRTIKAARTTFAVVARGAGATLVEAELHTGRTHQIRLHLAHLGHPVLGDGRYQGLGELAGLALPHHLLHAGHIVLPHPCRSATLDLLAPPPPLWAAVAGAAGVAGP